MSALEKAWYRKDSWSQLLAPVACLFQCLANARKRLLQSHYQGKAWPVPLVVIGNINVGGTGKTPLIIALARQLSERNIKAGIVSRGYGGSAGSRPMRVLVDSAVVECGDEALLLARRTNCPVVVCADRRAAVEHLLEKSEVEIILSDDGLQHYRMHRDLEIVVIDAQRGLGNGYCLPAGPLREPPRRLTNVDGIVVNGTSGGDANNSVSATSAELALPFQTPTYAMALKASYFVNLDSGEHVGLEQWSRSRGPEVHAVAGIGNPERFRDTLVALGLRAQLHCFPDHHPFSAADLIFEDDWPVVMTAKDAVKCEALGDNKFWYLEVDALIPPDLLQMLVDLVDCVETRY